MRTGNETANGSHTLGKGTNIKVNFVHAAELLGSSPSVFAEKSESVGIVNEYAEIVFLLESGNLVKYAHCAGHSVNAFGYQENSSAIFIGFLAGPCQNLFAINDVVVAKFVLASYVQTDSVEQTGVAFCVIYDNVVT